MLIDPNHEQRQRMPTLLAKVTRYLPQFTGVTRGVVMLLACLILLAGCVSETTGGFNVERSKVKALDDYIQLATGYLEQGDLLNAKRHLSNATELDSNNSEIAAIWGLVYSREGEAKLADENFRRALRLDARNSQARNNYAAFLFANSRFKEAHDELQKVVEDTEYPARAQAFENLGLAALRIGRSEDAEFAFGRSLQLNANQLRSSLELAAINLNRNNVLQARAYYRNYLTLMQFYNIRHDARSLLLGAQLEAALGNADNAYQYGALLESSYNNTAEYQQYKLLLDTLEDE